MIDESGYDIDIEIDGGINEKTLPMVLEAGANLIVAGSSVFCGSITERIGVLQGIIDEHCANAWAI